MYASQQMAPILQQIQSLKELSIDCTLFEDFIGDIFQIQQITSLSLLIDFNGSSFSEMINQLRYHEQSLSNLTKLDLCNDYIDSDEDSDEPIIARVDTTSNNLNEFIKFIINCPRIESITLPSTFPIRRFYNQLLKYEKKFGYHVRKKALYLTVANIQWIPGYSNGRRTHNVIIENENGDEPDSSSDKISMCVRIELFCESPSVILFFFCILIGKLIHYIQNIIINLINM